VAGARAVENSRNCGRASFSDALKTPPSEREAVYIQMEAEAST
jgi:hypothetical protein